MFYKIKMQNQRKKRQFFIVFQKGLTEKLFFFII